MEHPLPQTSVRCPLANRNTEKEGVCAGTNDIITTGLEVQRDAGKAIGWSEHRKERDGCCWYQRHHQYQQIDHCWEVNVKCWTGHWQDKEQILRIVSLQSENKT